MIKILLADDHWVIRHGITRILADVEGFFILADVGSGEAALRAADKHKPHVVIMDIQMPGMGGIEAIRRLLRLDPTIKVIALTMSDSEPLPDRILEMGAVGYLTKQVSPRELIQAIHQVHQGHRYVAQSIASKMALRRFKPQGHSPFGTLSGREIQVMMMIVNCQKVNQISRHLSLSPKTINGYRYRIFEKLKVSSDLELALLAIRHGMAGGDLIEYGLPLTSE